MKEVRAGALSVAMLQCGGNRSASVRSMPGRAVLFPIVVINAKVVVSSSGGMPFRRISA